MRVSKSPQSESNAGQKLQRLAVRHAVLRTKDVSAMGIHTGELTRMVRRGTLERIGPGRYRRPAAGRGGEHQGLIVAVNAVPSAAVCLLSALQFHGIGAQLPHQIWLAVPRGTRVPRLAEPPLRIFNISPDIFELGLESHRIGRATVRVYGAARTIVDCFRFRSRVGLDVALEALSEGWRAKRFTMDELTRIARRLRVLRVMQPYLEAIAL